MQTIDTTLPQVIDDCHELLKWLIPLLDQFPRSRRFTLGERLESGLLAVLEECIDAAYSKHKRTQLNNANRRLSSVRHLRKMGSDHPNYLFPFSLYAVYACYSRLNPAFYHQKRGFNIPMLV